MAYTQNWDSKGNIYYTDENGKVVNFKVNPFTKLANKAKATAYNVGSWINETNPNSEAYKQKVSAILGLATAPLGLGATLTGGIAKGLVPVVGRKIAQNMAQGIGSGAIGGAIGGSAEAGLNNKNIAVGGLLGATTGGLLGGLGGYGLGKVAQKFERAKLPNNAVAQEQYFNDYVADLNNKTKDMADFRAGKLGVNNGYSDTAYNIVGNYSIDDFNFVQNELPRSNKHRYFVETIKEEDLPKDIVKKLKSEAKKDGTFSSNYYSTKDGTVYSSKYNNEYTKKAVENAINKYNDSYNKSQIKKYINSDLVQNYHKNKNLEFNATPETNIVAEQQFYKSPVYNNKQSSAYSVALDNDGNVYYKRKSNHWGDFYTNKYDTDILKEHQTEFENFKRENPQLDERDFLESLGYDTSDLYGRVGSVHHFWDLIGGDTNKKSSQSGYIKIGNINEDFLNNLNR